MHWTKSSKSCRRRRGSCRLLPLLNRRPTEEEVANQNDSECIYLYNRRFKYVLSHTWFGCASKVLKVEFEFIFFFYFCSPSLSLSLTFLFRFFSNSTHRHTLHSHHVRQFCFIRFVCATWNCVCVCVCSLDGRTERNRIEFVCSSSTDCVDRLYSGLRRGWGKFDFQ